jgi:hypothetical protein
MIRSGIWATAKAFLYSGFFLKRDEFSRVEVSSTDTGLVRASLLALRGFQAPYRAELVETLSQPGGSTCRRCSVWINFRNVCYVGVKRVFSEKRGIEVRESMCSGRGSQ